MQKLFKGGNYMRKYGIINGQPTVTPLRSSLFLYFKQKTMFCTEKSIIKLTFITGIGKISGHKECKFGITITHFCSFKCYRTLVWISSFHHNLLRLYDRRKEDALSFCLCSWYIFCGGQWPMSCVRFHYWKLKLMQNL